MIIYAGCDLGSTTGKAVLLGENGSSPKIIAWAIEPAGYQPEETARRVLAEVLDRAGLDSIQKFSAICCTGYGRANISFIKHNVSEITCHARGALWLNPSTRTVIDVGGQDVKAISMTENGKVMDFAMNDKCAAGTGRFFEAMARTLHCTIEELGEMALTAEEAVNITSTCSVFAESEVITHMNQGVNRNNIAAGIHNSIARRLVAMTQRVGLYPDVVLTGGCAKNPALRVALERMLNIQLVALQHDPQIVGALGAALSARDAALNEKVRQ